jgi:site-specific recombinase XerD
MNLFFKDVKVVERMKEGPLGPYIVSYAEQLHAEGYARQSACTQLRLVSDFSRWLGQKDLTANEVIAQHTGDYLRYRKRRGYRPRLGATAALARLLKLLREQGVIAQQSKGLATTWGERLVREFDVYLEKERVLAPATRINYLPFVRQFLTSLFGKRPVELSSLCATDVTGFVRCHAAHLNGKRVQLMTTALRSFLRFARHRGDITVDLAACVPAVASWSLSALPRALPPAQVKQVLENCNRKTAVGRRDYAMLLLLARLGLRGGEVASLNLEDIDWENGFLSLRGKAGRSSQLPLPAEVGQAIAAYLKDGRPRISSSRRVFLRARAPAVGFQSQQAVGDVVRHALARAGIDSPRKGAHQFRHGLATEMLKRGASLREIGEILRHQSPETTAIYAKVDFVSLRELATPWPGGLR